jgi:hypothetical protein
VFFVSLAVVRGVKQETSQVLRERDAARSRIDVVESSRRALLVGGDSVPTVSVRGASGDTSSLAGLASAGVSLLYFQRAECLGCRILAPFVDSSSAFASGRLARIVLPGDAAGRDDSLEGDYTWIVDSSLSPTKVLRGVPTLMVVDSTGVIVSIAHSSVDAVARLLQRFGGFDAAPMRAIVAYVSDSIARARAR